MSNVRTAIQALSNQVVAIDVVVLWPSGYRITRRLIGRLVPHEDTFKVIENVASGIGILLEAEVSYLAVVNIRIDRDEGGFAAVISVTDGTEEDNA